MTPDNYQIVLFSIAALAAGVIFFFHAAKKGRFWGVSFVVIAVMGLVVELLNIRTTHSYYYVDFLIMIGVWPNWVPLTIAVSWSTLLFIVMNTSDLLGLRWYFQPMVDAMLGLAIDLAFDPVMSASHFVKHTGEGCLSVLEPIEHGGLGLWVWCLEDGDKAVLSYVPLGNFVGWWAMIAGASFALRAAQRLFDLHKRPLWFLAIVATGAATVATLIVLLTISAYEWLGRAGISHWLMVGLLLAVPAAILVINGGRLKTGNPLQRRLIAIPLISYGGCWWAYFHFRLWERSGELAPVLLVVTPIGTLLYLLPYVSALVAARRSR